MPAPADGHPVGPRPHRPHAGLASPARCPRNSRIRPKNPPKLSLASPNPLWGFGLARDSSPFIPQRPTRPSGSERKNSPNHRRPRHDRCGQNANPQSLTNVRNTAANPSRAGSRIRAHYQPGPGSRRRRAGDPADERGALQVRTRALPEPERRRIGVLVGLGGRHRRRDLCRPEVHGPLLAALWRRDPAVHRAGRGQGRTARPAEPLAQCLAVGHRHPAQPAVGRRRPDCLCRIGPVPHRLAETPGPVADRLSAPASSCCPFPCCS